MDFYGHNSGCFGETLEPGADDLVPSDSPIPFKHIDLHIGDYLGGSEGMTPEEEGIYIRFLVRLYAAGKPFSDDDRYMAHLMRLDLRAWRRIKAALISKGKIVIRCGCLTNKRFEKERIKRAEFLKQAAQAAKRGWAKRSSKDTKNATHKKLDGYNSGSQNATPLTASPGLRPNFGPKFAGSKAELEHQNKRKQ